LVDYFNNHFKNVKSNKVEENVEIIVNEKKRLVSELMLMPFVQEVFPSAANFLLVKFNNPALIMKATAAKGIILRDRGSQLNLKNTLRITIGDKKENDYLLQTLKTQGQ
jgi:histidinol-phosphate aminotransferase